MFSCMKKMCLCVHMCLCLRHTIKQWRQHEWSRVRWLHSTCSVWNMFVPHKVVSVHGNILILFNCSCLKKIILLREHMPFYFLSPFMSLNPERDRWIRSCAVRYILWYIGSRCFLSTRSSCFRFSTTQRRREKAKCDVSGIVVGVIRPPQTAATWQRFSLQNERFRWGTNGTTDLPLRWDNFCMS